MFRSLLVAALPLFTLSLSACASSGETDELAGESSTDVAVDGKADASVDGVYTYFEVSADQRRCASPTCGGFFMKRLNHTTTTCHDGASSAQCYTPVLDWSESGLQPAVQQKLLDASQKDAVSAGVYAIVRGRFAAKNTTTPAPNLGRFIVTEAWVAESATVSSGVFVKVQDNGVRCIAAPCPSTKETALNTTRFANIADIDWTDANLSSHQIQGFNEQRFAPGGFLIAGDRYTVHAGTRTAKGRTATNAYHRLANPAAPVTCHIGGCSSQICSAETGVISTCEWRPEYACYQTATCEAQADGACGWTQTPALTSCLSH